MPDYGFLDMARRDMKSYDGIVNNPSERIKKLFGTIDVNTK